MKGGRGRLRHRDARWPDHTRRSRPWGSELENGDAILIGDGACQGVQGCPGFVSQRKGCQELRETGRMSPWPCLSASGGEEGWQRRTPVPLTVRSTLCQSTASLLGHIPTTRQTDTVRETWWNMKIIITKIINMVTLICIDCKHGPLVWYNILLLEEVT